MLERLFEQPISQNLAQLLEFNKHNTADSVLHKLRRKSVTLHGFCLANVLIYESLQSLNLVPYLRIHMKTSGAYFRNLEVRICNKKVVTL